jgi:2-polyprenyl-6-methoxyphenol hydroxylase-like FAD-dependent oxidoreductase
MTHRAHLHELLRCTATSKDGVGRPAKLHFSSRVDSIDADSATISFEDGSNAQGDVILGADGVHSVTRSVISSDIKAQASHHSAFRFLVSREAAMKDSRTTEYFLRTGCMELWYSEDKKIVCYPCANNQVFNFVCIHPASLSNASESYDKSANKEVLLDIFKDFDPAAVAMLEKADTDSLKIYPLFDMLTLPTYVKGRLALIGDAAHPFLPHLAQGGAMAIEDGVSLGVMLAAGTPISEVPRRLQLYNNARYARATLVQRYTRIVGGDGIKKEEVSTEKLTRM